MFTRALVVTVLGAACASLPVAAQEARPAAPAAKVQVESEKLKDIRRLLEVTGSSKLGAQVVEQLLASFRQSRQGVPDSFWEELRKEMNVDELTELVVPIYDRHLSHEDVKQLIAFYESPVGRKLLGVQPQILGESMALGQEWGRAAAERVIKRLNEKGYGPKSS